VAAAEALICMVVDGEFDTRLVHGHRRVFGFFPLDTFQFRPERRVQEWIETGLWR
jgi:hypothetical protein